MKPTEQDKICAADIAALCIDESTLIFDNEKAAGLIAENRAAAMVRDTTARDWETVRAYAYSHVANQPFKKDTDWQSVLAIAVRALTATPQGAAPDTNPRDVFGNVLGAVPPAQPSKSAEVAKKLREYNVWRRYDGEEHEKMPFKPKEIGVILDEAADLLDAAAPQVDMAKAIMGLRTALNDLKNARSLRTQNGRQDVAEVMLNLKDLLAKLETNRNDGDA